ncbi:MAG TPA: hypothetical protein VN688_13070 [Gemmataceae bacterium]|nr:hypothetical protein [Gemmataceae bacterium]
MSATITLPLVLRSRLAAIRRRARLLRIVRGLGLFVLVLGLLGAAALLADYWLDLPALARQILFSVWITVGIGLLLVGVIVPLCRRIDAAALAAVIEQKYPDLGERLTSAVELADTPTEGHGSPVLIALLMDETEKHSSRLDFRPAVPARRAGVLTALAAVVVLLVAAPAFVWPQTYADLTQRFLRPWYIAPVPAPYTLDVTPGDVIAGRGRSITLSAHLTPRDATIALPVGSTLVVVDANGKETRQAMENAGNGDFTIAYKVPGDVAYRIEAGEIVSAPFHVTSVTPVELAADSPRITVTPPAYARAAKDEETFRGLVDLSPLQHSQVRFDFRFTRPAVAAHLEWMANGPRQPADAVSHPLILNEDRQGGVLTLPAAAEGKYRVVLEAEHDICTLLPGGTIRVRPDQPPTVLKFAGKEDLKAVLPYERVPLELEATDDIAVAGVELEYRVNDGKAVRQPLTLQGGDTPSAVAKHFLELAGKVKEDDRVHYRFHVRDNLPKEYQGPHVIVYPPDRWLTLQVARHGAPLKEQEILAQRKEINRKLDAIKEALLQEKRGVNKVQKETRDQATLPPEQAEQVQQLQQDNRSSQKALRDVAQTAEVTPVLYPIADLAREVANEEMNTSQKALDQAPRQPSPRERTRQLDKADEQLASAVKRLDELKKANDKLAQERLDQAKLETLADREKQLAEQAAEVAAKHPLLDPSVKPLVEKIKREQAEVAAELERLAQQSELLKQALDQARAEQTRKMAEHARDLAQAQRELAKAEAETERQRNADRLADLARKQQELAEQQAKLAQETRLPAKTTQTTPLKPEESQHAADALKQGDAQEAVKHQDQAARDLERLAQAFERAIKVSADPKEAARQLAQVEKALRQRVQEETAKKDSKQPLTERLKALQEEQNAIRQAAEQLSVPRNNADANKVKRQIAERAVQAEEALKKQDAPQAQAQMDETRKLLNRLADLLPNLQQRRQQAQQEIARLRRHQEEIARQVEQIKKDDPQAAKHLEEAARRQAEVAEALSKMDAPKQEARQERTTEATNRALADLMDRQREDVPASQQEARRQLERLEQALRGQKPADEQARDLARQQRELAQEAARAAADPKATPQQKQEIQRKQQQVAEQTRNLQAPEAPQRQKEAAEAARQAAKAAQTQPTAADTRQRMQEAARKLDELAKQMAGEESDPAKAERLARHQAEAAVEAERQPAQAPTTETRQRQQAIAHETQAVRAGDEARQEKQRATDALARAEKAPAKEQAQAQRQAAEALRDLADRLAGRNDPAAKANELARRQRELARDAAKAEPDKAAPEQARQTAQQQAELKRQLERIDGKDAPQAAKEAGETMAQAAKALEQAKSPNEAKESVARAAEAAEKLAEQLGKAQTAKKPSESSVHTTSAKPASQSPRQTAQQMAQQQHGLAKATQQAANQHAGQANKEALHKAMQQLAQQQRELNQQASQLPANQTQRGLEQARAAMNRAEQALTRKDAGQAQQQQTEAANALDRLAKQLPAETPPTARREPQPTPQALPSQEQSEQARQLARQQRELRDAVQRAEQTARTQRPAVQDNPAGELAKQQTAVAKQAADLARNVAQEQGKDAPASQRAQQAQQAAQQAARQMQAGALPQAREAGQQTAEQLRQLASQLARTPRGDDPQAPDALQQARQLGQRQEAINRQMQPLAGDARARAAQQQAQQRNLQQEAGELMQQLNRVAQQTRNAPQAQSALQRAANASQQAQQAMQQARNQAQQGQAMAERQAQEQAAQALDQAAREANQAVNQTRQASAKPAASGEPKSGSESDSQPGSPKTGEAVAQAQQQISQAQGQLKQGQHGQAQSAMRQAAQSLTQAAQQMAAKQQPGQPGLMVGQGRLPGGLPDLSAYGLNKTPNAGKSWGELPGELRTKIIQDMKARYGEDYARMIKYYFEQIAATYSPANQPLPPSSAPPTK